MRYAPILLISFLVSVPLGAASAADSDEFSTSSLDPQWSWTNEPSWSLTARSGWMRMTVPQNTNFYQAIMTGPYPPMTKSAFSFRISLFILLTPTIASLWVSP